MRGVVLSSVACADYCSIMATGNDIGYLCSHIAVKFSSSLFTMKKIINIRVKLAAVV